MSPSVSTELDDCPADGVLSVSARYRLTGASQQVLDRVISSGDARALVVLESLPSHAGLSAAAQLKTIRAVQRALPADSLLVCSTFEQEALFRPDLEVELKPLGSSFGKKVTGQVGFSSAATPCISDHVEEVRRRGVGAGGECVELRTGRKVCAVLSSWSCRRALTNKHSTVFSTCICLSASLLS